MSNSTLPTQEDLPSLKQLGRSTLIALAVATVLMITIVLPAEYGKDPTGIGSLLGLTEMGRIKMSLAQEAALDAQKDQEALNQPATPASATPTADTKAQAAEVPVAEVPAAEAPAAERKDEMSVTLAPDQGTEIKATLNQGQKVSFKWTSTGPVNFDIHGDSPAVNYHGYGKGTKVSSDEGVIVAKFDGNHGWYWRNRTSEPVTITLSAQGTYSAIKQME